MVTGDRHIDQPGRGTSTQTSGVRDMDPFDFVIIGAGPAEAARMIPEDVAAVA